MKLKNLFTLVFFTFLGSFYAQEISVAKLKAHVEFLASDKLKGRGTSSPEELLAADYIASEFIKVGIIPKGSEGYFFDYTFKKNPNPHSSSTENVTERKGRNVVGFLDNGKEFTIVIGAHYDHLGIGNDQNSLDANPEGKIHNGADDNASGTAGVIELARYYASNKIIENYNFLFMTYSGEELGLIGSKKWCDNPSYPLEKINCMINMDMIGRLNDSTNKLLIYGIGTSPTLDRIVDATTKNFSVKKDSAGIGPSDQTSFYLKDIPVLHYFTGQHSDYHKPSDDAEKINYLGMKKVLVAILLANQSICAESKMKFTATRNIETTSKRWKVSMGIMPDYAFDGKGVRVDGVTEGKPAFVAGIKKGDVIIKMGTDIVDNMEGYMIGLGKQEKGSETTVNVLREGKEIELKVKFN